MLKKGGRLELPLIAKAGDLSLPPKISFLLHASAECVKAFDVLSRIGDDGYYQDLVTHHDREGSALLSPAQMACVWELCEEMTIGGCPVLDEVPETNFARLLVSYGWELLISLFPVSST